MIIQTGLEIEEFLYQLSEFKLLKQDFATWKYLIGRDAGVAVEMTSTYHFSAMTRAEMTALRTEPALLGPRLGTHISGPQHAHQQWAKRTFCSISNVGSFSLGKCP